VNPVFRIFNVAPGAQEWFLLQKNSRGNEGGARKFVFFVSRGRPGASGWTWEAWPLAGPAACDAVSGQRAQSSVYISTILGTGKVQGCQNC